MRDCIRHWRYNRLDVCCSIRRLFWIWTVFISSCSSSKFYLLICQSRALWQNEWNPLPSDWWGNVAFSLYSRLFAPGRNKEFPRVFFLLLPSPSLFFFCAEGILHFLGEFLPGEMPRINTASRSIWNFGPNDLSLSIKADFNRFPFRIASAVLVIVNKTLIMDFPASSEWNVCVTSESPKGVQKCEFT